MLIGTKGEKVSLNWFRNRFGEDAVGYDIRRFAPIVSEYIENADSIMDAACGNYNYFLKDIKLTGRLTIGVDIDPTVHLTNKLHDNFLICDLHSIITEKKYDLILSLYTWEHLASPELVLSNFFNILTDNGVLIIIAPQRYYYISLIALFAPDFIKDMLWRTIRNFKQMPFKTYFRLCDRQSLTRAATKTGFRLEFFKSVDAPPPWVLRFPPLFMILCRLTYFLSEKPSFENFRSTFIAILRKE
jgi:SAM-dependent methyltransferase